MVLLDFITRQVDRHLSNIAIEIGEGCESFYPLYDNGRSLFYEDTEETVQNAVVYNITLSLYAPCPFVCLVLASPKTAVT